MSKLKVPTRYQFSIPRTETVGTLFGLCCIVQFAFLIKMSSIENQINLLPGLFERARSKKEPNPSFGFFVVSLQGVNGSDVANSGRLDSFMSDWKDTCKGSEIEFAVCPGAMHKKRGFGITQSWVNCIGRAIAADVSFAFFFEDDAQLFNNSFCHPGYRNALYRAFPEDLYVLLLGGHRWTVHPIQNQPGFVRLNQSLGAYGYAVPRWNLASLRDFFLSDLEYPGPAINPDTGWYGFARKSNKAMYASNPLIVKHPQGYSNTWKVVREEVGANPSALSEINMSGSSVRAVQ